MVWHSMGSQWISLLARQEDWLVQVSCKWKSYFKLGWLRCKIACTEAHETDMFFFQLIKMATGGQSQPKRDHPAYKQMSRANSEVESMTVLEVKQKLLSLGSSVK